MTNVTDFTTAKRERDLNNLEIRHTENKFGNREHEHDTTLNENYTQNLGVLASPDFFDPIETDVYTRYNGEDIKIENRKAIVRSDTGEVISTVGKNYKVLKNAEVFAQFDSALAESEIDLTGAYKRVSVCANGAETILAYSFPAYETTITNREVGDVIRLTTVARNSYSGTSMFSARFSSDRLICRNSMIAATDISYFAGRHTQNLQVEHAVEKIKQSINVYCRHAELYKRWANEMISRENAERCFQKMCVKNGYTTEFNEKLVNEHMEQFDVECIALGRTKWALYNTLTHQATHKEVQQRTKDSGNVALRQQARQEKLQKFLAKDGREFLDFNVAA